MEVTTTTPLRELAFIVCTALDSQGTTAVLTGGGAATIYSIEAYESRDLDFILSFSGSRDDQALKKIGFNLRGSTYDHPQTVFTLDFPPGPITIGEDVIYKWDTLREGDMLLHILKPTDSVLDRFVAYVHWKDRTSLDSAALVAKAIQERLDWSRIEGWCEAEGVTWAISDLRNAIERLDH